MILTKNLPYHLLPKSFDARRVFAFIGRNLIQIIPFPFDGLFGFDYTNVKEVGAGSILLVFMFTFSASLFNKIELLRNKLNLVKKNKHFEKDLKEIIA